jgi:hypothetical protein
VGRHAVLFDGSAAVLAVTQMYLRTHGMIHFFLPAAEG